MDGNQQSVIWQRFDAIDKTLAELNEVFNQLHGRLDPVLLPPTPSPMSPDCAPGQVPENPDSEVARRLARHRDELNALTSRISDVINLLQI